MLERNPAFSETLMSSNENLDFSIFYPCLNTFHILLLLEVSLLQKVYVYAAIMLRVSSINKKLLLILI